MDQSTNTEQSDKEWLTTLLYAFSWEDWEYTGSTRESLAAVWPVVNLCGWNMVVIDLS